MLRARRFFTVVVVVFASACASQSTAGSPERVARNPDVISTEELQDPAIAGGNAQYAIQQLRPAFFRTRGPQSLRGTEPATAPGALKISQDFGPLQPSSMLSSIAVRSLVEIRYLNAVDAQSRFGINANGGPVVILLSTKQ